MNAPTLPAWRQRCSCTQCTTAPLPLPAPTPVSQALRRYPFLWPQVLPQEPPASLRMRRRSDITTQPGAAA